MNLFGDEALIEDHDHDDDDFLSGAPASKTDELLPPAQSSYFIAHDDIERDMVSLWNASRMPHALVLNGLKGVGKATFAYRLARFILKESSRTGAGDGLFGEDVKPQTLDVSADHPVFKKIASGGHPDIKVIGKPFDEKTGQYKNDIPVDEIRKVAPFLRKTSSEGGWRIVLIDDANFMNRNGQNALLKILEEPPKNAVLILVTHGVGGVLPTIRSRCRFVGFKALSDDHIKAIMEKASDTPIMPGDLDLLIALSDGSAGQAIDLLNDGGVEAASILLGALTNINDMTESQIDTLALSYGKSGDKKIIDKFVFIMNWWFETLIEMAVEDKTHKSIGPIDMTRTPTRTLQDLLELKDKVDEHIQTCIIGNLDKRYMIYKALRLVQG